MDEIALRRYIAVMKNLFCILTVSVIMAAGSSVFAAKKNQPDRQTRVSCARDLRPTTFDSYGNPLRESGYANSFEQDRRRNEPGPDEVEDRNPGGFDARDPGF